MPQEDAEPAPSMPFDVDLRVLTIGAERAPWLAALIETARSDFRPRNFAERHLVDEMAVNKWRLLRIYLMEKAVYQHQLAGFRPKAGLRPDGKPIEPNEDFYHLAQALGPEQDAVILAALSRLEARFHRQFCAALRMLMAYRRFNPTTEPEKRSETTEPAPNQPNAKEPANVTNP